MSTVAASAFAVGAERLARQLGRHRGVPAVLAADRVPVRRARRRAAIRRAARAARSRLAVRRPHGGTVELVDRRVKRAEHRLRPADAADGKQQAGVAFDACARRRRATDRCRRRRWRRASATSDRTRRPAASPAAPRAAAQPPRPRRRAARARRSHPSRRRRRARLRRTRSSASRTAARSSAAANRSSRSRGRGAVLRSTPRGRVATGRVRRFRLDRRPSRSVERKREEVVAIGGVADEHERAAVGRRLGRRRVCAGVLEPRRRAAVDVGDDKSETRRRRDRMQKSSRPSGSPRRRPRCGCRSDDATVRDDAVRCRDRSARFPRGPRSTRARQRSTVRQATSGARRSGRPARRRASSDTPARAGRVRHRQRRQLAAIGALDRADDASCRRATTSGSRRRARRASVASDRPPSLRSA